MCCRSQKRADGSLLNSTLKVESKVVFLGDSGVGKSSLLVRYTRGEFSDAHEVTIGGAFLQSRVDTGDGKVTVLDIWDTAGQERFRALMPLYYRDAAAAVIVYDVGDKRSFERVDYWVNTLKAQVPDCLLYLVGNKADRESKTVGEDIAKAYANEHDMEWFETSAKTALNVDLVFRRVAEGIQKLKGN
ncbi:unnamed protein product [Blepharisma stoltei]|uniref:Uncharacterized protein n=1 Tax=Blepharisma stoltei TaxID=1481888 RepID=A0AAU9IUG8_9CILI|nr:unnamed protein product [Blepharisma stoltei]